jgi:ADP-heptose:LPS heptosyltransferase
MDPRTSEITHNLDNFRPLFIQHPGNYVNVYCLANRILDTAVIEQLRNTAWLTVPSPKVVEGRDIVINRTARWLPPTLSPIWKDWEAQGVPDRAVFIGLPAEHAEFNKALGWNIPHQPTTTLLEVAEYIAGANVFIGNQSVALSVAIGLGHPDIWCEARRDLPITRNECYFEMHPGIHYF